jgi:hypothetical protein
MVRFVQCINNLPFILRSPPFDHNLGQLISEATSASHFFENHTNITFVSNRCLSLSREQPLLIAN